MTNYVNLIGFSVMERSTNTVYTPCIITATFGVYSREIAIDGLPGPSEDTLYIVSTDVARYGANHLGRKDLVTPDDLTPEKIDGRMLMSFRRFVNYGVHDPEIVSSPELPDASCVRHRNGDEYRIFAGPDCVIDEATGLAKYLYRDRQDPQGVLWIRDWELMEDGRFERVY